MPACLGRSFPIRAVVGWDRLQAGGDVVPVVPGMDQQADGDFLHPQPAPEAPDPAEDLRSAHDGCAAAGVDTDSLSIRGGTHCECSWIPVVCAAGLVVPDVRVHAGLSPVGDWTGANADRPAVRSVS